MAFLNGTDPGLRQIRTPTVDTFTAGVGFTAGSSTTVTLTADPGTENSLIVTFDGITQHRDTYSVSGTTVTFDAAISTGVSKIEATYTTTIPAATPADASVTAAKLATSGTASSSTFLNGSMAWATPSGGKVLQFVNAENTANDISRTYHASTWEDTGVAVSITPSATNNKIIIDCMVSYGTSANSQNGAQFRLYRDSTDLHSPNVWGQVTHDHDGSLETISMRYIDTAPGTSAYSYKLYWWQVFGSNTSYLNRKGSATTPIHPAIITATEIEV